MGGGLSKETEVPSVAVMEGELSKIVKSVAVVGGELSKIVQSVAVVGGELSKNKVVQSLAVVGGLYVLMKWYKNVPARYKCLSVAVVGGGLSENRVFQSLAVVGGLYLLWKWYNSGKGDKKVQARDIILDHIPYEQDYWEDYDDRVDYVHPNETFDYSHEVGGFSVQRSNVPGYRDDFPEYPEPDIQVPKSCKRLSPSEIRYTQDSISITFNANGPHMGELIGETLDDLLNGRIHVEDIKRMSVFKHKKHWFSLDNRRLWVLKKYEELKGKEKIIVKVTKYNHTNHSWKYTTTNDGLRVDLPGDPGGTYWKVFQ